MPFKVEIICPECLALVEVNAGVACPVCGASILRPPLPAASPLPNYGVGDAVEVFDPEHVWHGRRGEVTARRPRVTRVHFPEGASWLPEAILRHVGSVGDAGGAP